MKETYTQIFTKQYTYLFERVSVIKPHLQLYELEILNLQLSFE